MLMLVGFEFHHLRFVGVQEEEKDQGDDEHAARPSTRSGYPLVIKHYYIAGKSPSNSSMHDLPSSSHLHLQMSFPEFPTILP